MILVTGASGNIGREVVRELVARRLECRVCIRPGGNEGTHGNSVEFDFLDARTFKGALAGVDVVFLLRPPAISRTKATLNVFLDTARRAGVTHVVFISVVGADKSPLIPHRTVERHLIAGPPGWTILRPGFFAQNLGGAYRLDIAQESQIYLPAGVGRVAFTDARDIAEVAVMAMTNAAAHAGNIYTLTGSEAFSFAQVAAMLSSALDRPVIYRPAFALGYIVHLLSQNTPLAQTIVQTILHIGIRFGQAQAVDATLEGLLARKPTPLMEYIRANQSLWTGRSR